MQMEEKEPLKSLENCKSHPLFNFLMLLKHKIQNYFDMKQIMIEYKTFIINQAKFLGIIIEEDIFMIWIQKRQVSKFQKVRIFMGLLQVI
ncbi:unnamed protein product [Paramecium sonneborni]|uniref:Uncharacterized protein n=1 Tax=Paramecium sonneborni TaxID=65129 RepID=A0A8S1M9H1_9CILI|nr:unnamed protein product [Paramecium sonneborni]